MVSASESSKYEKLNEAMIKTATGRDPISAAFKYQTPFNFVPQFKVWLTSNHPPSGDVDDDAFWGRLATIDFPRTHLGNENVLLKEQLELRDSLIGILTWAVEGSVQWFNHGLQIPGKVKETTISHREDQDVVKQWMEIECELGDDFFCPYEDLYASYRAWCSRNGVTPSLQKAFSKGLITKGLGARQVRYSNSFFDTVKKPRACVMGIRLVNDSWVKMRLVA
jgi:putative DNA primase/helicase